MRMPYGTALGALEASSDICTQESKPPIVQIGESHVRNHAKPGDHVVKLSVWLKMYFASLRSCFRPMGSAITVAAMRMKFALPSKLVAFNSCVSCNCTHTTKTVCNLAIALEMVDASTPWTKTQHMNTAYTMPFEGSQLPSWAMTMTETNMSAKP